MGAPFTSFKVYAGTTGAPIEFPVSGGTNSANLNLMSANTYDASDTLYQTDFIQIPPTGTNYSYERYMRVRFDPNPTFNLINGTLLYHSSGNLPDANLILQVGSTAAFATPVNSLNTSAYITYYNMSAPNSAVTIDLDNVASPIQTSATGYTIYGVIQLQVPSSVTSFGDTGVQTMVLQYDVS